MTVEHRSHAQRKRLYGKRLFPSRFGGSSQPQPQQSVHSRLKRLPRPLDLLVNQLGNIVVDSERGSHIMMLDAKTS